MSAYGRFECADVRDLVNAYTSYSGDVIDVGGGRRRAPRRIGKSVHPVRAARRDTESSSGEVAAPKVEAAVPLAARPDPHLLPRQRPRPALRPSPRTQHLPRANLVEAANAANAASSELADETRDDQVSAAAAPPRVRPAPPQTMPPIPATPERPPFRTHQGSYAHRVEAAILESGTNWVWLLSSLFRDDVVGRHLRSEPLERRVAALSALETSMAGAAVPTSESPSLPPSAVQAHLAAALHRYITQSGGHRSEGRDLRDVLSLVEEYRASWPELARVPARAVVDLLDGLVADRGVSPEDIVRRVAACVVWETGADTDSDDDAYVSNSVGTQTVDGMSAGAWCSAAGPLTRDDRSREHAIAVALERARVRRESERASESERHDR